MEKIDVYLAVCYGHDDSEIRLWRFNRVTEAAAILVEKGYCITVYSPITQSHPIHCCGKANSRFTYDFWVDKFDLGFLGCCKQLIVLRLPGWEKSEGIRREIKFAKEHDIPIRYADPIYDEMYRIKDVWFPGEGTMPKGGAE